MCFLPFNAQFNYRTVLRLWYISHLRIGAFGGTRTRNSPVKSRLLYLLSYEGKMAGQVGLEPTTIRLTAERSAIELLTNT